MNTIRASEKRHRALLQSIARRVRLLPLPVKGKLVHGFDGLDVGDWVRVQLISIDGERGFIDFKKVGSAGR